MDALERRKIFYPCLELNYDCLSLVYESRAAQIFQKWTQLKILGTGRMIWIMNREVFNVGLHIRADIIAM
jgi:hypothetical protein